MSLLLLLALAAAPPKPEAALKPAATEKDVVLDTLEAELVRSRKGLKGEPDSPVYYLSYRVTDGEAYWQSASFGALSGMQRQKGRSIDRGRSLLVSLRAGSRKLDNSHRVRGRFEPDSATIARSLPVDDDAGAISVALWRATHDAYRAAMRDLSRVRANVTVKVAEEDQADDFSDDKPSKRVEPRAEPLEKSFDFNQLDERLRRASAGFKKYPEILDSTVAAQLLSTTMYFVDSEGSRLREPRFWGRVMLSASVRADDGMELELTDSVEALTAGELPDEAALNARVDALVKRVLALKKAPVIDPFAGPAIISSRAAAVFFHEIFGHRVEGHRQKDSDEGRTFTKRVGKSVLPDFISVVDDPTQRFFGKTPLTGFYLFDEEGQPAQRAPLVENGILKGFLLGRSPIAGFPKSNGHGRAMPNMKPVSRMGNLLVSSSKLIPPEALREQLIAEVKRRNKPYGLLFDEISGGFTNTRTGSVPQSFKVIPQIVYRVYPDGRPDELVRGVDLVGTPLASFERILATADEFKVFNGYCGAESGWVPVSAVSPSLLVSEIVVERRFKGHERPPLLPPPPLTLGGAK
jgi:TldD protein